MSEPKTAEVKPQDHADYAMASDLGRKVGVDVGGAVTRTFELASTPYQREVVALAGAVSAIVFARTILRLGSVPSATDRDLVEALVGMLPGADQ